MYKSTFIEGVAVEIIPDRMSSPDRPVLGLAVGDEQDDYGFRYLERPQVHELVRVMQLWLDEHED